MKKDITVVVDETTEKAMDYIHEDICNTINEACNSIKDAMSPLNEAYKKEIVKEVTKEVAKEISKTKEDIIRNQEIVMEKMQEQVLEQLKSLKEQIDYHNQPFYKKLGGKK